MQVGLSRRGLFIRQWFRTRIGHTILDDYKLLQVTGLTFNRIKIVRVFNLCL